MAELLELDQQPMGEFHIRRHAQASPSLVLKVNALVKKIDPIYFSAGNEYKLLVFVCRKLPVTLVEEHGADGIARQLRGRSRRYFTRNLVECSDEFIGEENLAK